MPTTITNSLESPVWKIIDKKKYTKQGQQEIEDLYSRMVDITNKIGIAHTRALFTGFDELHSETFAILQELCQFKREM